MTPAGNAPGTFGSLSILANAARVTCPVACSEGIDLSFPCVEEKRENNKIGRTVQITQPGLH